VTGKHFRRAAAATLPTLARARAALSSAAAGPPLLPIPPIHAVALLILASRSPGEHMSV
jgi:hypothetical protein